MSRFTPVWCFFIAYVLLLPKSGAQPPVSQYPDSVEIEIYYSSDSRYTDGWEEGNSEEFERRQTQLKQWRSRVKNSDRLGFATDVAAGLFKAAASTGADFVKDWSSALKYVPNGQLASVGINFGANLAFEVIESGIDWGASKLKDRWKDQDRTMLRNILRNSGIDESTTFESYQHLFERTNLRKEFDSLLDTAEVKDDSDFRDEVFARMVGTLSEDVERLGNGQIKLDERVTKFKGSQESLNKGFGRELFNVKSKVELYQKETRESLDRFGKRLKLYENEMKSVQVDLDKVEERVEKLTSANRGAIRLNRAQLVSHGKRLGVIEDTLYSSQPPSRQIKLIESGAWSPDEDKKELNRRLNRLKIQNGAEIVGNSLRGIGLLADSLGVSNPKLSKAINTGTAIARSVGAFASGDIIGGLLSAVSIFKKRKHRVDPAVLRHRQVMKEFRRVNKKLDDILKNQEQVFIAVQKTIKLQIQTLRAIEEMHKDIRKQFDRVYSRLDEIEAEVILNRGMLKEILDQDKNLCLAFFQGLPYALEPLSRDGYGPSSHPTYLSFYKKTGEGLYSAEDSVYSRRRTHFKRHHQEYKGCVDFFATKVAKLRVIGEVSKSFLMVNTIDSSSGRLVRAKDVQEWTARHIDPLLARIPRDQIPDLFIERALVAEDEEIALSKETKKRRRAVENVLFRGIAGRKLRPIIANRVDTRLVLKIAELALYIHVYPSLVGSAALPTELPDIVKLSGRDARDVVTSADVGRQWLQDALALVEVALAQERLLAGRGVLSSLKEDLESNDRNKQLRVLELMERMRFLERNLMIYSLHSQLASYLKVKKSSTVKMAALKDLTKPRRGFAAVFRTALQRSNEWTLKEFWSVPGMTYHWGVRRSVKHESENVQLRLGENVLKTKTELSPYKIEGKTCSYDVSGKDCTVYLDLRVKESSPGKKDGAIYHTPLPDDASASTGYLSRTLEHQRLLEMKNALIAEIAGYDTYTSLSGDERDDWSKTLQELVHGYRPNK